MMVGPNLSGYVSVGMLGGMAFEPYFNSDNTLLSELNHITAQEPTEGCGCWRWFKGS